MHLRRIKQKLVTSPFWRTIFSFLIPLLAALFSGTFVVELSSDNKLIWSGFYKTKSFYVLVALTVIIFLYNRLILTMEREPNKFIDDEYCIAYMRSQFLPEAAEKFKEDIRNGDGGDLVRSMEEVKRMLR